MDDQNGNKGRFWDRLKKHYHLIVRNQETFEEVYTIKLNLLNAYLLICTLVVLVAAVVLLLLFFTPLKSYVPGYGELESNAAYVDMYKRVQVLERQLQAQDVYIESFRRMISSDVEYAEARQGDSLGDQIQAEVLDRIPEDEILRQNVELTDQLRLPDGIPARREDPVFKLSDYMLMPPVEGIISLDFMPEQRHFGIDIIGPEDSPVKSVLNGYVISSGWNVETGNTIAVQHENNLVTLYKHNSSLLKNTGDYVRAGEAIAIIGNTGKHTDGPHLHFEMWLNGTPLNPRQYIVMKNRPGMSKME